MCKNEGFRDEVFEESVCIYLESFYFKNPSNLMALSLVEMGWMSLVFIEKIGRNWMVEIERWMDGWDESGRDKRWVLDF